jgi:hypothetical protein
MIIRLARRVHRDFQYRLTTRQRSSLVAYLSFATTVAAVRGLTTGIHRGELPVRDIRVGSVHVHHYIPGIALLTLAGAAGVRGSEKVGVHCLLGGAYGAGCALVVDELPMLVDLRAVYWSPEGRWAVELSLTIIALAGA